MKWRGHGNTFAHMTLDWNRATWTKAAFDYNHGGESWSEPWGGSKGQWYGTILPRIQSSLVHDDLIPPIILEIGCGFGRWTRRLLEHGRLIGVDLSPDCVEHCRKTYPEGFYSLTNGKDLGMIADGSIDFCFSFDSLVHADADVMRSYVPQILWKLKPYGRAFIHHSNWGDTTQPDQELQNGGCRGADVSGEMIREWIHERGGRVLVQEKVTWLTAQRCGDAFTLFGRADKLPEWNVKVEDNRGFMEEATRIRRYCI